MTDYAQDNRANTACECAGPGDCARHGVHKSRLEFQRCAGIGCTVQTCAKYWNAWESSRMPGQTKPVESPKPPSFRGFGDWVSAGIRKVTGGLVTPCGGCKKREAWLNHWFPATLPPIERVTLHAPVRHLMFHLWPVAGFGAWQWNCDRLKSNAHLFNGRRIVAIAVSPETDDAETVKGYLRDFTDEFIILANNQKLREVVTWIPMLERLEKYQSDQDVTFTCHGKCVRHRVSNDAHGSTIFRWTDAMYETCLNWSAARSLLERHATAGSFRREGNPERGGWGPWHYSGTFFWFRNRDSFRRNWRYVPQRFYGTEAWPGLMFRPEEAGVICCDDVQDLYKIDYWEREIEPQLAAWRARHV
ncbi:MAG: hypothetical protein KGO96_12795 [Elusimicrobia bacterium]|nr:hypothetical protein [Elusimicrobiota bacterium]